MYHNASSENGEEPPSRGLTRALKEVRPAGRGFWANVPDSDWNHWHWQLKHRLTTVEQLQRRLEALRRSGLLYEPKAGKYALVE